MRWVTAWCSPSWNAPSNGKCHWCHWHHWVPWKLWAGIPSHGRQPWLQWRIGKCPGWESGSGGHPRTKSGWISPGRAIRGFFSGCRQSKNITKNNERHQKKHTCGEWKATHQNIQKPLGITRHHSAKNRNARWDAWGSTPISQVALLLLHRALQQDVPADAAFYGAALESCAAAKRWQIAVQLLEELGGDDVVCGLYLFRAISQVVFECVCLSLSFGSTEVNARRYILSTWGAMVNMLSIVERFEVFKLLRH